MSQARTIEDPPRAPAPGTGARARGSALLLEGDVGRALAGQTLPLTLSMASTFLFGVVDAWFVGQLGGLELSALAFAAPITLVLTSMASGLGVAATSVVARAVGEGQDGQVKQSVNHALWWSAALGVVLAAVGMLTLDAFARLLGASPEVVPLIREYLSIWYAGLPLLTVPTVGGSVLRAMGDARTSSSVQAASVVLNGVLDPVLILGVGAFPGLGLAGAAWASVLARAMMLGAFLYVLGHRERMLEPSLPSPGPLLASGRRLMSLGVPTITSRLAAPVSMLLITRMVAAYGSEAVAALGVGGRVANLATLLMGSLAMALLPFIGQNWGAGHKERARQGLSLSMRFCLGWGVLLCAVMIPGASRVASWFSEDPRVVEATTSYLRILALGLGFQGMGMQVSAAFNATGKPLTSTLINLAWMFVLFVPLSYAGSCLLGREGIFIGGTAANVLAGVGAMLWAQHVFTKEARDGTARARAT